MLIEIYTDFKSNFFSGMNNSSFVSDSDITPVTDYLITSTIYNCFFWLYSWIKVIIQYIKVEFRKSLDF